MQIRITDSLTIHDIQSMFNKIYPFLKIEFFRESHKTYSGSHKDLLIPSDTLIKNCGMRYHDRVIEIKPDTTVAELENMFQSKLGLFIQVFRKSGDAWIETTVTDNWTLEKQNKEAELFHRDAHDSIKNQCEILLNS